MDNHAKDLLEELLTCFLGGWDAIENQIISHNPSDLAQDNDNLPEERQIQLLFEAGQDLEWAKVHGRLQF